MSAAAVVELWVCGYCGARGEGSESELLAHELTREHVDAVHDIMDSVLRLVQHPLTKGEAECTSSSLS